MNDFIEEVLKGYEQYSIGGESVVYHNGIDIILGSRRDKRWMLDCVELPHMPQIEYIGHTKAKLAYWWHEDCPVWFFRMPFYNKVSEKHLTRHGYIRLPETALETVEIVTHSYKVFLDDCTHNASEDDDGNLILRDWFSTPPDYRYKQEEQEGAIA